MLEAFAAERLLTLAAGTVEISHEALLTAWPLLRDTWLADTHADRIARTRLHATAADWARHSRDPSYLYTGTLLAAATDTATRISADPARPDAHGSPRTGGSGWGGRAQAGQPGTPDRLFRQPLRHITARNDSGPGHRSDPM